MSCDSVSPISPDEERRRSGHGGADVRSADDDEGRDNRRHSEEVERNAAQEETEGAVSSNEGLEGAECNPVDDEAVDDEGDDDKGADEAEEEAEIQRRLRDPGMPTKQEIIEQN